jgi:tetratricopeptide (TPR) repeat protein
MSSARWIEPSPAADLRLRLALLCDALDMLDRGAFLFAVCEEGPLRERLMRHVHDHVSEGHRDLIGAELSPEQPDLAGQLEQRLLYESPREDDANATLLTAELVHDRSGPPVVLVHTHKLADAGMPVAHLSEDHPERARVEQTRRALRALNFQRERLSRLGVPLVFWLSQNALGQVAQRAADVFAARSGIFFFETPRRGPTAPPPMRTEAIVDLMDHFHRTLLPPKELRRRAALYEQRLEREQAAEQPRWPGIAFLCRDLANIYRELDDYERTQEFQDRAIEAYQNAIAEQEAEEKDETWALLQVWLGLAHYGRMRGDRAENLARAIACYQEALRFRTPEAAPLDYAMTQNNLGNAYSQLPTGDRAENLARAIACYQEALTVYTPEAAPIEYAGTQNNLGNAYSDLPTGDRAQNLARAIACYQEALTVYIPEAAPIEYAGTQNNLGIAYSDLPTGDRAQNLARAIACYQEALTVYTPEAAPHDYAMTQNNLGTAHLNLPTGDRAQNLARAIACYQEALRFRTPEAAPLDYAMTQNNLGNTYSDLPTGDQAENLARAIACFQEALEIFTPEAFPHYHDLVARNMEQAQSTRLRRLKPDQQGEQP